MHKYLRNTLGGGAAIAAITLLAESCPDRKDPEKCFEDGSEEIVQEREDVKLKLKGLIEIDLAAEAPKASVDVVNEIRECVEDSGEYNCISSPFSSTRCYSESGNFPVTISSPGLVYDADGNMLENGVMVSIGPSAFSEVFEPNKEADDACDYALDLLDQNIDIHDLDRDFYSDRAFGFWENAPSLMPSLKIQNYKLFNDLSENYDISERGGDVFAVNIGDWETVIYSDISGSRDEFFR